MPDMPEGKNDERHQKMLDALSSGMTWEEAADYVGVNSKTLWRWCQADPSLAEKAAKARDTADDMVEAVLFNSCMNPDASHTTARIFWLKSRRREVYGERITQEVTGKDGQPFQAVSVYIPDNGRNDSGQAADH